MVGLTDAKKTRIQNVLFQSIQFFIHGPWCQYTVFVQILPHLFNNNKVLFVFQWCFGSALFHLDTTSECTHPYFVWSRYNKWMHSPIFWMLWHFCKDCIWHVMATLRSLWRFNCCWIRFGSALICLDPTSGFTHQYFECFTILVKIAFNIWWHHSS